MSSPASVPLPRPRPVPPMPVPSAAAPVPRPRAVAAAAPVRPARWSHAVLVRGVEWLGWGSLALSLLLAVLILGVSERWWVAATLVYLPRSPWLVPPLLAVGAALVWNRRGLIPALLALAGTAGPVMGFSPAGVSAALFGGTSAAEIAAHSSAGAIRVVSLNVQAFRPDFPAMASEIGGLAPDVVLFQEGFGEHPLLKPLFADWHVLHEEEYFVASRWPIERLGICESPAFDRNCALAVRVKHPYGDFVLADVHLATARFGLQELSPKSILTGDGPAALASYIERREAEALAARTWIEELRGDLPLIAAGDFNMPVDSHILQNSFGDLRNSFVEVGFGYGYTAPNKTRTWPSHLPWSRVDHILATQDWTIRAVGTGTANGSDHKLVWAVVEPAG